MPFHLRSMKAKLPSIARDVLDLFGMGLHPCLHQVAAVQSKAHSYLLKSIDAFNAAAELAAVTQAWRMNHDQNFAPTHGSLANLSILLLLLCFIHRSGIRRRFSRLSHNQTHNSLQHLALIMLMRKHPPLLRHQQAAIGSHLLIVVLCDADIQRVGGWL